LKDLIQQRKAPGSIVCDNGTEFTSKAMFFFAKECDVKLLFIQPGKPTQNAFVESFNGKFRQACLNQHWFRTLEEARYEINKWREHYNTIRTHSSLNYQSPLQFLQQAA
jgi:putative transposase